MPDILYKHPVNRIFNPNYSNDSMQLEQINEQGEESALFI
jgi:hypothetical protein